MKRNDFLNICADAIQAHEGFYASGDDPRYPNGTPAYNNHNPGNLTFVGQDGAVQNGRFCAWPDYYAGRDGLTRDLSKKLDRFIEGTLRDLITQYAPPNENDTEAYINAVEDWFIAFGWPVSDTMKLSEILALDKTTALICLNEISQPAEWHHAMDCLKAAAKLMPQLAFTTRYSNESVQEDLLPVNSPTGVLEGVSNDEIKRILALVNEGQPINILLYNNKNLQFHEVAAGGTEAIGKALSFQYQFTAFGASIFGTIFTVYQISTILLHEITHELFTLSGDSDYLHAYMQQHSGYAVDNQTDVQAVYDSIIQRFQSLQSQVVTLQKVEISWLQRLVNWLLGRKTP